MFAWFKGLLLSGALALGLLAVGGATTTEEASARWGRGYYRPYYSSYYRPYGGYYRPYYGYRYYGTPYAGYYRGPYGSGVTAGPVRVRWW